MVAASCSAFCLSFRLQCNAWAFLTLEYSSVPSGEMHLNFFPAVYCVIVTAQPSAFNSFII